LPEIHFSFDFENSKITGFSPNFPKKLVHYLSPFKIIGSFGEWKAPLMSLKICAVTHFLGLKTSQVASRFQLHQVNNYPYVLVDVYS